MTWDKLHKQIRLQSLIVSRVSSDALRTKCSYFFHVGRNQNEFWSNLWLDFCRYDEQSHRHRKGKFLHAFRSFAFVLRTCSSLLSIPLCHAVISRNPFMQTRAYFSWKWHQNDVMPCHSLVLLSSSLVFNVSLFFLTSSCEDGVDLK